MSQFQPLFTPGPYTFYFDPDDREDQFLVIDQQSTLIATVEIHGSTPDHVNTAHANARLLATTPELLAALRNLLETMTSRPELLRDGLSYEAIARGHFAIAMAEGRPLSSLIR